jgi:hypothetical protein
MSGAVEKGHAPQELRSKKARDVLAQALVDTKARRKRRVRSPRTKRAKS